MQSFSERKDSASLPNLRKDYDMKMLESIGVLKTMAKEGGVPVDKAIAMVEVYERHIKTQEDDRRSHPHEKDLVRTEIAKLHPDALGRMTARQIADELVEKGVGIRPNVQGVLSVISRTRKQLLLSHQPQAAE
jgi:hypothetical protein